MSCFWLPGGWLKWGQGVQAAYLPDRILLIEASGPSEVIKTVQAPEGEGGGGGAGGGEIGGGRYLFFWAAFSLESSWSLGS
jgi:hypothetical protein